MEVELQQQGTQQPEVQRQEGQQQGTQQPEMQQQDLQQEELQGPHQQQQNVAKDRPLLVQHRVAIFEIDLDRQCTRRFRRRNEVALGDNHLVQHHRIHHGGDRRRLR